MIPAGKMNHRIRIERPTTETSETGRVSAASWSAIHHRPLPASCEPVSAGEQVRGQQIVTQATALFIVRWLPNVTTALRLVWLTGAASSADAPTMQILRVHDPDGYRALLWIQARELT